MRALYLVLLMVLAGCGGRPLAEGERALAKDFFGDGLDVDKVRVVAEYGIAKPPPSAPLPQVEGGIDPRPGICDRTAPTPPQGPPPAWAIYNAVHYSDEFYRDDTAPGWPHNVLLPHVLILTHELMHVWQWQNRKLTGYRPTKAALESVFKRDPYFYEPNSESPFLQYDFEQQASLMEDYLCYGLFDPTNPRRAQIRPILIEHFPMDRVDKALGR